MAIYIQIQKTKETEKHVIYEFGPSERFIGSVLINRASQEISLIHIDDPSREDFYLSRVCRVLRRHLQAGELPQSTCYAA